MGSANLREMLSQILFDREMRTCCAKIEQSPEFMELNCANITGGILPVDNFGYGDMNYYQYFWECIAKGVDHSLCCYLKGVE
jgi:hypothetical protein